MPHCFFQKIHKAKPIKREIIGNYIFFFPPHHRSELSLNFMAKIDVLLGWGRTHNNCLQFHSDLYFLDIKAHNWKLSNVDQQNRACIHEVQIMKPPLVFCHVFFVYTFFPRKPQYNIIYLCYLINDEEPF